MNSVIVHMHLKLWLRFPIRKRSVEKEEASEFCSAYYVKQGMNELWMWERRDWRLTGIPMGGWGFWDHKGRKKESGDRSSLHSLCQSLKLLKMVSICGLYITLFFITCIGFFIIKLIQVIESFKVIIDLSKLLIRFILQFC